MAVSNKGGLFVRVHIVRKCTLVPVSLVRQAEADELRRSTGRSMHAHMSMSPPSANLY